jgi:hypothetical protein
MRRASSSSESAAHSRAGAEVDADPDVFSPGQDKKEKTPSSGFGNPGGSFSLSNYWGQAASFLENVGEVVSSVSDYVAPLSDDELDESESREEEDGERNPTGVNAHDIEGKEGGGSPPRRADSNASPSPIPASTSSSGHGHPAHLPAPSFASAPAAPVPMPAQQRDRAPPLAAPQYDPRFVATAADQPHDVRATLLDVSSSSLASAEPIPAAQPAAGARASPLPSEEAASSLLCNVSLGSPTSSPHGPLRTEVREVRAFM